MKITKKMMIKFRAFSLRIWRLCICHAGTADVPRRHGKRATPAWQTCNAGVADGFASSKNGKSACKNFYKPFDFGGTRKRVKKGVPARMRCAPPITVLA